MKNQISHADDHIKHMTWRLSRYRCHMRCDNVASRQPTARLLLTCRLLDELNMQPMYTCYRCLATGLMQEDQHKNMKESLERQ